LTMPADYYRVLGVDRRASTDEIKKAFRKIARETHPDANPGDPAAEARFRQAAEAYEVLSDPTRRQRYDRGDTIDLNDLLSGFGGIDEILRSVFGDGGFFGARQSRQARGRDILVHAEVTLERAASGGDVPVDFHTRVTCTVCSGSGAEPGTSPVTCPECGGAGQVRATQRSIFGTVLTAQTCTRCGGSGSLVETPCAVCSGGGAVAEHVEVSVEIPPGVSSGTRLRLSGRGEAAGIGGHPGDLYVEIGVLPHHHFERHDNDLWYQLSLGISEAALGTVAEVPLIDGSSTRLEIPAGTQPGEIFRLDGSGMPVLGRRTVGDLIVVAKVAIPVELTPEEEELMVRWSELRGEKTDRTASTS
jgi:molecular chaperone DnaJ